MSADRWIIAAVVLAIAVVVLPRLLGGRKVSSDAVRQKKRADVGLALFIQ